MIDNNLNNEKKENFTNETIECIDENIINTNETPLIEDLNNNKDFFTPVVSDGIFEEEILDLNEEKKDSIDNVDELDNTNLNIENLENFDNKESIDLEINENNDLVNSQVILENESVSEENNVNNIVKESTDVLAKEIQEENTELNNNEEVSNINNEVVEDKILQNDNNETTANEETLLSKYGENLSIKEYVCNPAIGRDNEIKQLILTLLTPEKSGILVGKPGIGKTAIVEGLGYQIQKGNVPLALKEYQIHKLNTSSLLGVMPGTDEPKIQVLLNEIKGKQKLILFIDEIHTLIGAGAEGDDSLDFANIFKPGLDRGNIKIIGATTSDEYDRYILTDKAFVRRFQKIEVLEPTKEHTVKIMLGSLPKLEHKTGTKLKYTPFVQEKIMTFIVDLTTEYRRVYELSARYPDVSLTILQQAFSYAVFDNKNEVSIRDVRKAIANTKLVYPDVIKKELVRFNEVFSDIYLMETPQRLKGETTL